MNVVPFGRTPEERRRNAEAAAGILNAEAAKAREAAAFVPKWRSKYPSSVEERRAIILAGKPACKVCERPFARRTHPPPDLVCTDCRKDMQQNGPTDPPADPGLF